MDADAHRLWCWCASDDPALWSACEPLRAAPDRGILGSQAWMSAATARRVLKTLETAFAALAKDTTCVLRA
jgi:hypothetical protein